MGGAQHFMTPVCTVNIASNFRGGEEGEIFVVFIEHALEHEYYTHK